jgi:predicted ATPase
MARQIHALRTENYRSLANLELHLGDINVMFGPCGVGKSTLLDALWFLRDCAINGVDHASRNRDHGIGLLWDGASPDAVIAVELAGQAARYRVEFSLGAGRIDPRPGERLTSLSDASVTFVRLAGTDQVSIHRRPVPATLRLREPDKLSLARYLDANPDDTAASELDAALRYVHHYSSRRLHLHSLQRKGSESGPESTLEAFGRNLWSVLRNLKDQRERDDRYDTIMDFMRRAFPGTFEGLMFEQLGPTGVYARMLEFGRRESIKASGVSDGHLQMLIVLAALFGAPREQGSLIMFDEPELSLHPWPLSVMGEAMRTAASDWNRQLVVATHSPVLISQFEPADLLAVELDPQERKTVVRRASEIEEIADLLEQYSAGAIYMAQEIAPQGGQSQT